MCARARAIQTVLIVTSLREKEGGKERREKKEAFSELSLSLSLSLSLKK